MRRLMRDALLVAATAACVWFVRGEAQDDYTVVYGEPMQVICTEGRIENAEMSQAALDRVTLTWRTGIAPQTIRGNANFDALRPLPRSSHSGPVTLPRTATSA